MKKFYIFIGIGLLFATSAQAHGLATSKQAVVGNYVLELEYDKLSDVKAREFMIFNVDIIDASTKQAVPFDRAYIRFRKENQQTAALITDIYPTTLFGGIVGGRIGGTIENPGNY